jgi:1-aminocyclopropane-1-carboxylate deaminase/D-cysteine desulfhydrase-like pyridoxal-dependent ACC family enzyme
MVQNTNFAAINNAWMIEILEEEFFLQSGVEVGILRLDKIHPVVSGNKIFKLKYYLQSALATDQKNIITLGGPYSNHLHATAFAAKQYGLKAIGLLKGIKPPSLSVTLEDCLQMGMELRWSEKNAEENSQTLWIKENFPDALFIPQGGQGELGIIGASEIMSIQGVERFDSILAACGTGTMGAGLIMGQKEHQRSVLISVLKNNFSVTTDICDLLKINGLSDVKATIDFSYHLGGYAKKSAELFDAMNLFYKNHNVPTDFVYTGKLIYAFYKMLKIGAFSKGEKVLLIHSGGLQGNRSLTKGELIF